MTNLGNSFGLSNSTCSGRCPLGYFCPSNTGDTYQIYIGDLCKEFILKEFIFKKIYIGDLTESHKCGNEAVYCPLGSSVPLPVPIGYYSVNLISGG